MTTSLLAAWCQPGHLPRAQRPAIRLSLTGHHSCRATTNTLSTRSLNRLLVELLLYGMISAQRGQKSDPQNFQKENTRNCCFLRFDKILFRFQPTQTRRSPSARRGCRDIRVHSRRHRHFRLWVCLRSIGGGMCDRGPGQGIAGKSAAGVGTSLLAGALSVFGFVTSPSLWLLTAGLLVASQLPHSSPRAPTQRMTFAPAPPPPRFSPVPTQAPLAPADYCQGQGSTQAVEQCEQYYAKNQRIQPPLPLFAMGGPEALAQAEAQSRAAILECRNRRLSGDLKSYVESAQCSSPTIIAAYQQAGYRYMDLIASYAAKRLELSEKTDQGKLTEAQATAEMAQFFSGLVDRERQRDRGVR